MGDPLNCSCAEVFIVAGISGVQTGGASVNDYVAGNEFHILGPGQTQFTRMPFLTCWLERPLVKATIAPFVDV